MMVKCPIMKSLRTSRYALADDCEFCTSFDWELECDTAMSDCENMNVIFYWKGNTVYIHLSLVTSVLKPAAASWDHS